MERNLERMAFLFQNAAFSLGDGRRVSFWKNVWCDEEALSFVFLSLFTLTAQKDVRWQICGIVARRKGDGP